MKRLVIILCVLTLLFSGCVKKGSEPVVESYDYSKVSELARAYMPEGAHLLSEEASHTGSQVIVSIRYEQDGKKHHYELAYTPDTHELLSMTDLSGE